MRTVGMLINGKAAQKKTEETKPKDGMQTQKSAAKKAEEAKAKAKAKEAEEAKKAEEAAKTETATDTKGAEAKGENAKAGEEEN